MTDQGALFEGYRRRRRAGPARRSANATITALRRMGRLDKIDQALVVTLQLAADNFDAAVTDRDGEEGSPFVVSNTARTYLMAIAALYGRAGVVEADADDEIWSELSAPLGYPTPA